MPIDAGRYVLGPDNAELAIGTARDGVAAAVGHDLVLEPERWSADLDVADDLRSASLHAEFDLASLQVVTGTGGAKPLSQKDRREILANAAKVLGPAASASLEATAAVDPAAGRAGSPERATITGELTLHGTTQPMEMAVAQEGNSYVGRATVRQTDFGIKPFAALLGALRISDEVSVTVRVQFE